MIILKRFFVCFLLLICSVICFAQDSVENDPSPLSFYVGYDLGEMAFNKFQNFAGELGMRFKNDHTLRFTYMNVKLTEDHLSSGFAGAVDGDNVSGLWHGYDLLYDIPVFRFKRESTYIYAGLSAGYHENTYQHTILDEAFDHKSATVGFDIGYREANIFNVKGLYINFQLPVRYNFNKVEETKLGDSFVTGSRINRTISFFVGYEF